MKPIKTLLAMLFISLLSSPSWSETMDDLVERNDLYYEKFTNVPFTGKVTGEEQGSFKNGKREGAWVEYFENGQLKSNGHYKNGKYEGAWVFYYESGQLYTRGNYKNSKLKGAWVSYYENGQIRFKGNYKNDKEEGVWVGYNEDGTVFKPYTGTYKGGKKISD
jgi:antitoxin component YwqK of YwqJK toxin-antitoxin module